MKSLISLWNIHRTLGSKRELSEPLPYRTWKWLWQRLPLKHSGPGLFDRLKDTDWDVVLILDACRYDVLSATATNAVVRSAISPASSTPEFLDRARDRGVFDGSTYVSANPQTTDRLPGSDISLVSTHQDGWDERLDTVPAPTVYEAVRERLDDLPIVAHLMQPHYPHICEIDDRTQPVPNGLHPQAHGMGWFAETGLQDVLASGTINLDRARESYEACVTYAWEHASAFASALATEGYRVVITADHGELFGEWGFVEHPVGVRIDELVTVPWVVFEPVGSGEVRASTDEQLRALGYRS